MLKTGVIAFFVSFVIVSLPLYFVLKHISDSNLKDVILVIAPALINGFAYAIYVGFRKSTLWYKFKYYLSGKPITWQVSYLFKGDTYIELNHIVDDIQKTFKTAYHDIKVHAQGLDKCILTFNGVFMEVKQQSSHGIPMSEGVSLNILLQAESPIKTLKRYHYSNLIKQLPEVIEKYGFKMNKVTIKYIGARPKFIKEIEERETLEVEQYKINFKQSQNLNLSTQDDNIVCTGKDIEKCYVHADFLMFH